jgi:hypothetical protein
MWLGQEFFERSPQAQVVGRQRDVLPAPFRSRAGATVTLVVSGRCELRAFFRLGLGEVRLVGSVDACVEGRGRAAWNW